ncbi:hypothetical protein BRC68_15760 [Halobacteriales archaeon QH_6_64_20]|nr:MAG: hypothetical protein BRC68_15760 [Halobacteriales archaeon QH_6_64_20]
MARPVDPISGSGNSTRPHADRAPIGRTSSDCVPGNRNHTLARVAVESGHDTVTRLPGSQKP